MVPTPRNNPPHDERVGDEAMNAALPTQRRDEAPPKPEVRQAVKDLLLRSPSFAKLPAETQRQIAHDTAQIADYLAAPEGLPGNQLPSAPTLAQAQAGFLPEADPSASRSTYERDVEQVNKVGGGFEASAAREGAEVAGMLMKKVNFPTFVASLIQGVFHAIVQASIEQMEAYGKLVSSVAQSLNSFRDENVSENQGRDHLVDQFPDLFEIGTGDGGFGGGFGDGGGGGPRVQLRDGVEEDQALKRVNESLPVDGGPLKSLDLQDEDTEHKLVQAARTQLATSRQQLLATMVLMGINRIVVTDGKIQAKILYDFQARDNQKRRRSAAAMDYARDQYGNVQKTRGREGQYDRSYEGGETKGAVGTDNYEKRDGNWYSKGSYKYTEQPIMTAMSTASEATESALQTRASLAGVVDINFKSDYFPLEKMADSFQIAQIQNASTPGRGAAPAATGNTATPPAANQPAASGATPAATTPAAQPAK
jgi:hypothetical protein